MRLSLALFGLLILAAGCDFAPQTTPAPSPVVHNNPAPKEEIPTRPEPSEPVQDKKPGDNPKRIYQLRELERATVVANGKKIQTWLMDTEAKGQEGLMWLTEKDIKENEGGLFVYSDEQPRSFWMQNTLIPLDIIYMDATGKVVNIVHGEALNEKSLPSEKPAKYVLELKLGRAQKFGIKIGSKLTIPANATNKEG